MAVHHAVVRVTTTGVAGSASGNADTDEVIQGELLGFYLDYHASAPATTDVTVKAKTDGYNLLVVSNNATDGFYAPAAKPVDNANVAITDAHRPFPVCDKINVALAQSDALTNALVCHIYWRD